MKYVLGFFGLCAVVMFSTIGVDMHRRWYHNYDQNPLNEVREFYETPHQLRKMFVKAEEVTEKRPGKGRLSGGFFMFLGGISGNFEGGTETRYTATNVRFAWEIQDNAYVITTLPLEKIRIKLVDKVQSPTVSFTLDELAVNKEFGAQTENMYYDEGKRKVHENLRRILANYYDPHEALAKYLAYATFTVRASDWPSDINLPVNQGYSK